MRKIADFIVERRLPIFIIMLALTLVCGLLALRVGINTDMTKYLPDDSQMKVGVDIMDKEFPESDTDSSIRVMFTGLNEEQKTEVLFTLQKIKYVSSVEYEPDSEDFNKNDKTLFLVKTDFDYGSDEIKSIEKELNGISGYDMKWQSNSVESIKVPPAVLLSALALLIVILFVMCESWIEPLLFLASTGAAVALNLGTNLFLGSVSELAMSIAPILQLVLSMDYSIILINRYRQELEVAENKYAAMKAALAASASSILSSAFTTVVGLLVLLLMSFKIGPELGIILAKGVFISMVTAFTVLPSLILIFDGAIKKSAKKSPKFKMAGLTKFSLKLRPVMPALLVGLFVASFILSQSTGISFSQTPVDTMAGIFPRENNFVMLYENEDEEAAWNLASSIENDSLVKEVTGYSNTAGKRYSAEQLKDLGDGEFELDDIAAKLLYYKYFDGSTNKLSFSEFIDFLNNNVLKNEKLSENITEEEKDGILMLKKFNDRATLKKEMTAEELASFLEMEKETAEQLLYLRAIKTAAESGELDPAVAEQLISGKDPAEVIADLTAAAIPPAVEVLPPAEPAQPQAADIMSQLTPEQAAMLAASGMDISRMSPAELAALAAQFGFGGQPQAEPEPQVDPEQAAKAAAAAAALEALTNLKVSDMTLPDFMDLIIESSSDPALAEKFDAKEISKLEDAREIIDYILSDKKYPTDEMTSLLSKYSDNVKENDMKLLYLYQASVGGYKDEWTLSAEDLLRYINDEIMPSPEFSRFFDDDIRKELSEALKELDDNLPEIKGDKYSRILIRTQFPDESDETEAFVSKLADGEKTFSKPAYLIGTSVIPHEISDDFNREFLIVSIITALSIFLVVMITFRSAFVPALLVLLVQTAVYITVVVVGIQGYNMMHIALLVVQSILMGATIDYAIVFMSYYRENRGTKGVKESLQAAYEGSVHTIMTSGLILILVTAILGIFVSDQTTSQVCSTISIGALASVLLILFVLPGSVALLDRFTAGKKRLVEEKPVKAKQPKQEKPVEQKPDKAKKRRWEKPVSSKNITEL
ncbi:MAG TPA: MMPL family transporter [Clostridiales bacterium]|nr:MMPL family transporter [Clostridiales bacterium]